MSADSKKALTWFLGIVITSIIYTAISLVIRLGGIPTILIYGAMFFICRTICKSIDDKAMIQSAMLAEGETAAEEISWDGKRYDAVKYVIIRSRFYYQKIRNNGEIEPLLKDANSNYPGYPFTEFDIRAIHNAKAMYDEAQKKRRAQLAEEDRQRKQELEKAMGVRNESLEKAFSMYHDQEDQQGE